MTVEPSRLHREIRDLREKRDFAAIHAVLTAVPRTTLISEPDLLLALSSALSYLRRHQEARVHLLEIEDLILNSGNPHLIRRWQLLLAIQLIEEGELFRANYLLQSSLSNAERASDHRLIADSNNSLGVIASYLGELERASSHFRRSIIAWQNLGESQGVGIAHYNLGLVLREWGRLEDAVPHFSHAEEYFGKQGIAEERVFVTAERALLQCDLGDLELAEKLARTAVTRSLGIEATGIQAAALRALGAVLLKAKKTAESERTLISALKTMDGCKAGMTRAEIDEELSILYASTGNASLSRAHLTLAKEEYLRIGSQNHARRLIQRFQNVHVGPS